jgi:hypothetical protein
MSSSIEVLCLLSKPATGAWLGVDLGDLADVQAKDLGGLVDASRFVE